MFTIAEYFAGIFPGRVQKIAVNAGLGCPNRDGTISTGGCSYCNNAAFNPSYAFSSGKSITDQLGDGIRFFASKGVENSYLAFFQSYSNTYGPTDKLIALYEEALRYPGVKGLVIATRPDCLAEDLLNYFESRFGAKAPEGHPYLLVELGVESTNDATLRAINRGHDFECARKAILELDKRGIAVGVHIILGLPGETREDFMTHAERLSALPVSTLKLHQLQIIRDTNMALQYEEKPWRMFSAQEYALVVKEFIAHLRPDIALDRFVSETPKDMLIAPGWGLKPSQFLKLLD